MCCAYYCYRLSTNKQPNYSFSWLNKFNEFIVDTFWFYFISFLFEFIYFFFSVHLLFLPLILLRWCLFVSFTRNKRTIKRTNKIFRIDFGTLKYIFSTSNNLQFLIFCIYQLIDCAFMSRLAFRNPCWSRRKNEGHRKRQRKSVNLSMAIDSEIDLNCDVRWEWENEFIDIFERKGHHTCHHLHIW